MKVLLTILAVLATWPFIAPFGGSLAFVGTALALGIGGAALGGIAGAIPKKSESTSGLNMDPASALETSAAGGLGNDFSSLRSMFEGGANSADYANGMNAQRGYADMLGQYAQTGGLPGQEDLTNANIFAQRAFDPQRTAMGQSFEDQKIEASRLSASLGRSVDDPILQAKLRSSMMRQQASLASEQGAFANQFAMQLPQQRLAFAGQRAGLLDEIGQRAASNRQLLMSLGSNILGNERSFRVQTAEQYGKKTEGGGLGGAISGALGGAGMGMQAFTAGRNAGLFGGSGGGMGLSGPGGGGNYSNPFSAPTGGYDAAAFAPRDAFRQNGQFGFQGGRKLYGDTGGF